MISIYQSRDVGKILTIENFLKGLCNDATLLYITRLTTVY